MNYNSTIKLLKLAWKNYREALKLLNKAGWLPNAAEKAWCAAENAIKALITLITEKEPKSFRDTIKALEEIENKNSVIANYNFKEKLIDRLILLHGSCFYGGICEPKEEIIRKIVETKKLINDVEKILSKIF